MSGKIIIFNDKKINQSNFYRNRKPFIINNIDINKVLISEKEPYGKKKSSHKYFIGYNDDNPIRPLCIKLPQMISYVTKQCLLRLVTVKKVIQKSLTNC